MLAQTLTLTDFRNVERAGVELAPRLTFLVGDNAQGKTNALEALAYALTLKPLRPARLGDLVRRGASTAVVDVSLTGPALPWQIHVEVEAGGRQVLVNGKLLRDPANLLGAVALVAFTPDDLALVKGAPELRRRSLDRFVFQVQPGHLRHARDYQRALRARNLLLRRLDRDRRSLDAFGEMLAIAGARLMAGRHLGISLLRPALTRRHRQLAPDGGELTIDYRPALAGEEAAAGLDESAASERLRQALQEALPLDLARRQTCRGPHLDDVELALDGVPTRRFASQGQSRSIVLALRLAEADELRRARGEGPLLLADDLLAELDDGRASALLTTLDAIGARVVATGTRLPPGLSAATAGCAIYSVRAGRLSRAN
ncbi:MAG: DNA replication and repair protein RecF [Deltaproteobacteria bacterium]|nr:DNA replication and repair protein RecF [Deltaproteobacteria bacterium]